MGSARSVARLAAFALVSGVLGVGAAWAVRAGVASQRTVLIGLGVLMAAVVAFGVRAVRSASVQWDDDPTDT